MESPANWRFKSDTHLQSNKWATPLRRYLCGRHGIWQVVMGQWKCGLPRAFQGVVLCGYIEKRTEKAICGDDRSLAATTD